MGRIRSIKPEFPQSETIGRLSRDARLLFVQLWTLVDDDGRTRAAPRMLAGLLYPYDDDARTLIDGWLRELEREACIVRYAVDGGSFLEIVNWAKHQKIDHKAKSKLPPPPENTPIKHEPSEILASPREEAREPHEPSEILAPDLGSRIKDMDQEEDREEPSLRSGSARKRAARLPPDFVLPAEWREWAISKGYRNPQIEHGFERMKNWSASNRNGAKLDWFATWRNWITDRPPDSNSPRAGPSRPDQRDGVAVLFREISAGMKDREQQSQTGDFGDVRRLPVLPEVEGPDGCHVRGVHFGLKQFP